MNDSRNGVTALPRTPAASAAANASARTRSCSAGSHCCSAGIGFATMMPSREPSSSRAAMIAATSPAPSTRQSSSNADSRSQNAGNVLVP